MNTRCENRATRKNKYTRHTPKDLAMPNIPWRPRVILPGRNFRLPVQATDDNIALEADHFETIATRWCERDTARYYYLRSPSKAGRLHPHRNTQRQHRENHHPGPHPGQPAPAPHLQRRAMAPPMASGAKLPPHQNPANTTKRSQIGTPQRKNPRLLVIPTRPCPLVATTARGTAQSALCQLPSGLSKLRHRHLQIQRLLSLGTQPPPL